MAEKGWFSLCSIVNFYFCVATGFLSIVCLFVFGFWGDLLFLFFYIKDNKASWDSIRKFIFVLENNSNRVEPMNGGNDT